jgi:hypothetical protein
MVTVLFCDRCGEPVAQGMPAQGHAASDADVAGAGPSDAATSGAGPSGAVALGQAAHADCVAARLLEPPRFCPACRRRMKVQVLPAGWIATCVEHGDTRSM